MCSWWPSPAFPMRTKAVTRVCFPDLRREAAMPCLPLPAPGRAGAAPRLSGGSGGHGRARHRDPHPAPHRTPSTAPHRLRNVGAAVRPGSCSSAARPRLAPRPGSQNVPGEGRRPPTTPGSAERGGAGRGREVPALSVPLSPPGVVVPPPLWALRGARQGLGVPARRGPRGGQGGQGGRMLWKVLRPCGVGVRGLPFLYFPSPPFPGGSRCFPGGWRCPGCRGQRGPRVVRADRIQRIPGRQGRWARGGRAARLGLHRDLPLRGASAQRPRFFSLFLFPASFRGACGSLSRGALCAMRAGLWPWFAVMRSPSPSQAAGRRAEPV